MSWYWEEGADALVGAHFQSSSNSILVKDPERDHVAATEHYLDNLSTYFTPIRPIPLSSLHKKSPQNSGHTFVVYTTNHWFLANGFYRERVKTPYKSNAKNEGGEPNYEP